jgi:uncharacterized protein YaaQ
MITIIDNDDDDEMMMMMMDHDIEATTQSATGVEGKAF